MSMSIAISIANRRVFAICYNNGMNTKTEIRYAPILSYYNELIEHLMEEKAWGLFHMSFVIRNSVVIFESLRDRKPFIPYFDTKMELKNFIVNRYIAHRPSSRNHRISRIVWDMEDEQQVAQAKNKFDNMVSDGGKPFIARSGRLSPISVFTVQHEEVVIITLKSKIKSIDVDNVWTLDEYWQSIKKCRNVIERFVAQKEAI